MRILVFSHEYPPVGGGGGHVARDLCEGLARQGHEIKLITADLFGGLEEEDPPRDFELIRVATLRRDPARASMPAMVSFIFSAIVRGLLMTLRWRPDVMHVHFAVPSGPIAWLISKLTGVPYLLTVHLGDIPGGTPEKTDRWFKYIQPFTYPIWDQAARVVAVSSYSRELALRHYQVDIDVIHNGVDLSLYPRQSIQVHDPPRIAFAGRFVPQKNPLAVIKVLGTLKHLDWDLIMMGNGELFDQVKNEIQQLGLEDKVTLPGWVSPEVVKQKFLESDILFMPSLSEGLPVVGVQALACGLAFVVSDIGGFSDIVKNGENGFTISLSESDPSHLFRARLGELLVGEKKLTNFKKRSAALSKNFNLDTICNTYDRILQDICC